MGPRRRLWPFLAVFVLVYLCSLDELRFLLDDWCQLPRLAGLSRSWDGLRSVLDNRWLGNPRFFFLTWWLQAAFARLWGTSAAAPYFLVALASHLASCLLLRRLLLRADCDEATAGLAATLALVIPTSAADLFWISAWQFVLPVLCLLAIADRWSAPGARGPADAAIVCAGALGAQFFGEQCIPLLYAGLALAAWRELRSDASGRGKRLALALLPAGIAAAALFLYFRRCVRPFLAGAAPWSWPSFWKGAGAFIALHARCLWPWTAAFGKATVRPSFLTVLLCAATAFVLARAAGRFREPAAPAAARPARFFLLWSGAVFALTALPVLAGMARGLRSEVEYRYLYPSGLALAVLLAVSLRARLRGRAFTAAAAAAAIYFSWLMIYDLREVWGAQKRIDERLWAAIDAQLQPRHRFLVTDGMQTATLLPLRSSAMSDFQDDFGVGCRMRVKRGANLLITRRYQDGYESADAVVLVGYREGVYRAPKAAVLAAVFRYGPRFSDLLDAPALAFADFEAYKRFRQSEPISFEPWTISR